MIVHRGFIGVVSALLLSGCASSGAARSERQPLRLPDRFNVTIRDEGWYPVVLNAPSNRVWELLPVVYKQLGLVGAPATNTRAHLFMTPPMMIPHRLYAEEKNSDYFDCGRGMSGPLADVYQVSFALITRVTASSGTETLVEVLVDGFARDRVTSGEEIACTGTGKLERAVADLLQRQLRS